MDHLKYLKQIGRKGGAVKSEAKTVAARANAKLPRPGAWKCGECGATPAGVGAVPCRARRKYDG